MQIQCFKMPFKTSKFNINQTVFILHSPGSLSAYVKGRFRGKNKYISCWVNWDSKKKTNPNIKTITISKEFYDRIKGK